MMPWLVHDRDAQATEDARHLRLARVDAEPGLADRAAGPTPRDLAADVAQRQLTRPPRRPLLVRRDEAFVLEDAGDRTFIRSSG